MGWRGCVFMPIYACLVLRPGERGSADALEWVGELAAACAYVCLTLSAKHLVREGEPKRSNEVKREFVEVLLAESDGRRKVSRGTITERQRSSHGRTERQQRTASRE